MRFSQIFLTMGYNTVVKVDKVTEIKSMLKNRIL